MLNKMKKLKNSRCDNKQKNSKTTCRKKEKRVTRTTIGRTKRSPFITTKHLEKHI